MRKIKSFSFKTRLGLFLGLMFFLFLNSHLFGELKITDDQGGKIDYVQIGTSPTIFISGFKTNEDLSKFKILFFTQDGSEIKQIVPYKEEAVFDNIAKTIKVKIKIDKLDELIGTREIRFYNTSNDFIDSADILILEKIPIITTSIIKDSFTIGGKASITLEGSDLDVIKFITEKPITDRNPRLFIKDPLVITNREEGGNTITITGDLNPDITPGVYNFTLRLFYANQENWNSYDEKKGCKEHTIQVNLVPPDQGFLIIDPKGKFLKEINDSTSESKIKLNITINKILSKEDLGRLKLYSNNFLINGLKLVDLGPTSTDKSTNINCEIFKHNDIAPGNELFEIKDGQKVLFYGTLSILENPKITGIAGGINNTLKFSPNWDDIYNNTINDDEKSKICEYRKLIIYGERFGSKSNNTDKVDLKFYDINNRFNGIVKIVNTTIEDNIIVCDLSFSEVIKNKISEIIGKKAQICIYLKNDEKKGSISQSAQSIEVLDPGKSIRPQELTELFKLKANEKEKNFNANANERGIKYTAGDIVLKLNKEKFRKEYGPQHITRTVNIYNERNEKLFSKSQTDIITSEEDNKKNSGKGESNNSTGSIFDWNIKEDTEIESHIKPWNTLEILISHANDAESFYLHNTSESNKIARGTFYLRGTFFSHFIITPYLPTVSVLSIGKSALKRKVEKSGGNGTEPTDDKIYDLGHFQRLSISVGVGLKYRSYSARNLLRKWSIGLYLYGLNLNPQETKEDTSTTPAEVDKKMYPIRKGDIVPIVLGEFEVASASGLSIPLQAGIGFRCNFKSDIEGYKRQLALYIVFGLGLTLK